ncbi:MAG: hypothetical protein A2Y33_15225 [Spirochaetes bacterium GWF1_51_8]|nr:MAG: hypothetical protein A2Y33_15225 [Spirochaetes bacterium GWF1_51_8]
MRLVIAVILTVFSLFGYVTAQTAQKSAKVFVLCYHTFHNEKKSQYNFTPDEFKQHIESIKALGYHFISMDDFLAGKFDYPLNVMITIDDGNATIKNIYNSVLKKNGIMPVFFIYPNIIGKKDYALKFDELVWFKNDGVSFGAHGYFHEYVNQKLYDLSVQRFKDEIYKAKDVLEQKLSIPIKVYAYPFGLYSPITIQHMIIAGYKYAFTINWGYVQTPIDQTKKYEIPRYLVETSSWKSIYETLKKHAVPKNK